jgi:DNA/RNA-binding domain of Phe-tRNA-synthetase-like protein
VLKIESHLDLDLTWLLLEELEVSAPRPDFDADVSALEEAARTGAVAASLPARALYRRFGIDPTRHRPSSEALLRRLKRGQPLPRVNSLVDLANVLSVRFQIPVGLYDLDKVDGENLVVRLGEAGEAYTGVGGSILNLEGAIVVADDTGPIGNPTMDSERTNVTTETQRAAWLFFLPPREPVLDLSAEMLAVFGRGLVRVPNWSRLD